MVLSFYFIYCICKLRWTLSMCEYGFNLLRYSNSVLSPCNHYIVDINGIVSCSLMTHRSYWHRIGLSWSSFTTPGTHATRSAVDTTDRTLSSPIGGGWCDRQLHQYSHSSTDVFRLCGGFRAACHESRPPSRIETHNVFFAFISWI